MSRVEILEKVTVIFRDLFDDDRLDIDDTTSAEDIEEWDSLMHINLITAVQSEFNIRFSMDDIYKMKNVGAMIDIIQKLLD